jgi:hypothetical protein
MRIINQELLDLFGTELFCGLCGYKLRHKPEVHHVFSRGAGRLDIRINLIPLGGPWDCGCHHRFHDGRIKRDDILAAVSRREGFTTESIELTVYALRRAGKSADPEEIKRATLESTKTDCI